MKIMEFDISGCAVEQVLIALWNCPETLKSSYDPNKRVNPVIEIDARDAGIIFRGADPERTGIIRLDLVKKPQAGDENPHPQYGFAPLKLNNTNQLKLKDDVRHLYLVFKGRWRTSKLHPNGDTFQGFRVQFRVNRQGGSFFKFHETQCAREIMIRELHAIEIVDMLTQDDIGEFPEYFPILHQANYQAVAFVQLLLQPYFSAELPPARKIKTNRFLGMRRQNTFYTKPAQVGYSLNNLSVLKSAFLSHLRATISKRAEEADFHALCLEKSECYERLVCSYLALGGSEDDLEKDLSNKGYYRTHSDPSPALAPGSTAQPQDDPEDFADEDDDD